MKTKPLRARCYWVWPQHLTDGRLIVCEPRPFHPDQIPVLVSPIKRRPRR